MENAVRSESLAKAQKRYYEKTKKMYKGYYIRMHRERDADVIAVMESKPSKQDYVKELVRRDNAGTL